VYLADYGFVPGTLGEDGNPLDALVLVEEPTFPGCLIRSRPLGMFRMIDEMGATTRSYASPPVTRVWNTYATSTTWRIRPARIQHFFLTYKELEPGKSVAGAGWADCAAAEVKASRHRLRPRMP